MALLSLLAMIGPLATDMYLASFTDIGIALRTNASTVQLTLTTFLLGMGVGQLFFGPLSDRYGRRPVLLSALMALVATSITIVFVPTISMLIGLRFIQGFTGAAGVVLSRAIVVDLTKGAEAVQALSLIATMGSLGPLLAPIVGGVVAQYSNWRTVFAVLAGMTVLMLTLAVVFIPESLLASERHAGGITSTFSAVGSLLKDRIFVGYMITFAAMFGAVMAYISSSPFIGQSILGMNQLQYGFSFAASATSLIVANLFNAKVAMTIGAKKMQIFGVFLTLSASLLLLTLVLTEWLTVTLFIITAFFLTMGVGFTMSNTSALALLRADHARGSASALLGSSQFVVGGAVSPLVGVGGENTALPASLTIAALTFLSVLFALANRWALRKETRED